jgi:hypothetical protein
MSFFRNQQRFSPFSYPSAPDLLDITPLKVKHCVASGRVFQVLSDVISDLKIRSGDIVSMRTLTPLMRPPPYAVVAVHLAWTGVLLLRQYIPPRLLITNSSRVDQAHMQAGRVATIVAFKELGDPF